MATVGQTYLASRISVDSTILHSHLRRRKRMRIRRRCFCALSKCCCIQVLHSIGEIKGGTTKTAIHTTTRTPGSGTGRKNGLQHKMNLHKPCFGRTLPTFCRGYEQTTESIDSLLPSELAKFLKKRSSTNGDGSLPSSMSPTKQQNGSGNLI